MTSCMRYFAVACLVVSVGCAEIASIADWSDDGGAGGMAAAPAAAGGSGGAAGAAGEGGGGPGPCAPDADATPTWSFAAGSGQDDDTPSLALHDGKLAVGVNFRGGADFGAGQVNHLGGVDIALGIYDASTGDGLHALGIAAPLDQQVLALASNQDGVFAAGRIEGSVLVGAWPLVSAGLADAFVAGLSPDLEVAWAYEYGDAEFQTFHAVAAPGERLVLAGLTRGAIGFGDAVNVNGDSPEGDLFVVALSSDAGMAHWATEVGASPGDATVTRMALTVDDDLRAYVAGQRGSGEGFVTQLTPDGTLSWSLPFEGPGVQAMRAVTLDPGGGVVVGGTFEGTAVLNHVDPIAGEVDFGTYEASLLDALVVAYKETGEVRWARQLSGDGNQIVRAVTVRGERVLIAGAFSGQLDFGGTPDALVAAGATDAFWAELSLATGEVLAGSRAGNDADQTVTAAVGDGTCPVWLAGENAGQMNLGGPILSTKGGIDLFVTRLRGEQE